MPQPTAAELSARLISFIQDPAHGIGVLQPEDFDSNWRKSGVYAVLDCVFSSMAHFQSVENALQRFSKGSALSDTDDLTFTTFLQFVQGDGQGERPTPEQFEEVAATFLNQGQIAGRLKVEVAYDVCEFFAQRGLETKAALQALPKGIPFTCDQKGEPGALERLVMDHIVNLDGGHPSEKVKGMGLALGAYLLICLGDISFVKPDTLLLRVVGRIGDWQPRPSNTADFLLMRQAITCAADHIGIVPAHLDHVLWKYERSRESGVQ